MATQRGYYREEMERAANNINMALTHLVRVVEAYAEAHPEVSQAITAAGDGLVVARDVILQVREAI